MNRKQGLAAPGWFAHPQGRAGGLLGEALGARLGPVKGLSLWLGPQSPPTPFHLGSSRWVAPQDFYCPCGKSVGRLWGSA